MNVSETGQKQMGPLTVDFQGGGGGTWFMVEQDWARQNSAYWPEPDSPCESKQ